jgi:hypothetical protein
MDVQLGGLGSKKQKYMLSFKIPLMKSMTDLVSTLDDRSLIILTYCNSQLHLLDFDS